MQAPAGELAEKAGIRQGYLAEIESSTTRGSLDVLMRIAAALGVEAIWGEGETRLALLLAGVAPFG